MMPCLGSRKKSILSSQRSIATADKGSSSSSHSNKSGKSPTRAESIRFSGIQGKAESILSQQSYVLAQITQEYNELKSQNSDHLEILEKQASEIEQLRSQLNESVTCQLSVSESIQTLPKTSSTTLLDLETQNKKLLSDLADKERILKEKDNQIQELLLQRQSGLQESSGCPSFDTDDTADISEEDSDIYSQLQAKDSLLQEKQNEIDDLKRQWEAERAELVKPALEQVTAQLEELKQTNTIVVERLTEKENELAELRSALNRRDRKPKTSLSKEQENQRRLNRLTIDMENDRALIQKLDELNKQLETQKEKHEAVLESHAKTIAEKDHALLQHQKSLKQLKISHTNATTTLEQNHLHQLKKLQLQHERAQEDLKKRLKQADSTAKSTVNDELDQILVEFEQSQHNHSAQVAHLQQSYEQQISAMRQGQQAEIRSLIGGSKNSGIAEVSKLKNNSKFSWPPVAV